MKIIIAGGSGQVGQLLREYFLGSGHQVIVLTRQATDHGSISWDGVHLGDWCTELEGADVLINLAGRSVNCQYNPLNRQEIIESRVNSTRILGQALAQCQRPPRVWLQASTATYYAHRYDAPNDEDGPLGGHELNLPDTWRFSLDVARNWEAAATNALPLPQTRLVLLRSAMVMDARRGGVFSVLSNLVRWGLGGTQGDGRQMISWIHARDFCHALDYIINKENLSGPVNLAGPNPLPNREFLRDLRRAWRRPFGLPAFRWMLEIGAYFLGTETELILKSRYVVPRKLVQSGFQFEFLDWPTAAKDLVAKLKIKK